jgi:hypothetical protein
MVPWVYKTQDAVKQVIPEEAQSKDRTNKSPTPAYKTQSKYTKSKSPYPAGAKGHKECKHIPSYRMQAGGNRDGVPVSWLSFKTSFHNSANWPNTAGMEPGVFKTQSKRTKNKSPYPTGTI